jgi:hypothetical protein
LLNAWRRRIDLHPLIVVDLDPSLSLFKGFISLSGKVRERDSAKPKRREKKRMVKKKKEKFFFFFLKNILLFYSVKKKQNPEKRSNGTN